MTLAREFFQLLAELEVTSNAPSRMAWTRPTAPARSRGGGSQDSACPSGDSFPPHVEFRQRWERCRSDEQRQAVFAEAAERLRGIRFAPAQHVDLDTREGRLTVGRDARDVAVVAQAYGFSVRRVYQLRQEAREFDARARRAA